MKNNVINILLMNNKLGIEPRITVCGSSMNPVLFNGDIISIIQLTEYVVGDIIVFKYNSNEYIVHRVVYKDEDCLVCKGDNSFRLEYVKNEDVIGKVSQIIRNERPTIPPKMEDKFITMSYRIGLLSVSNSSNMRKVILSNMYKQYYYEYLKK